MNSHTCTLLSLALFLASATASPVALPAFVVTSYVRVITPDALITITTSSPPTINLTAYVPFENCHGDDYTVYGKVNAISISPCERATPDAPCTFVKGRNYTVEVDFVSQLSATQPRSSMVAGDAMEGPYQYSGQSFDGCKYASCPIVANVSSTYVYHFQTLGSSFDHLTFNVTQGFFGPSMFCAGTDVAFRKS